MDRLRSWLDPAAPSSTPVGVATAVLLVAACTLLVYPLAHAVNVLSLDALYVPGVLFVTAKWGAPIGIFTAFLSAVVFDFFHVPPVGQFTDLDTELILFMAVSIGAILVAILTQRARSAEQRRQEEAASRARVVAAADDERRRVVRDLHDGAQQRLVHAVIVLKLALRELKGADSGAGALVEEALQQAEQANFELRELAHGILPSVLTHGGLRAAVNSVVSRISLPVSVNVCDERFPPGIEATAYFIVSEALTNVVKHAHAASASVTVRAERGMLRVEIRDNGAGGARGGGAGGLRGLEDRASALGGRVVVESPHGRGTRVYALLPLPDGRQELGESRR